MNNKKFDFQIYKFIVYESFLYLKIMWYICSLFKTILNNEMNLADLNIGDQGVICEVSINDIPLKLLEMGCLPGERVTLIQKAPFKDPLYIKVNGSHIAIRVETARQIAIEKI